MELIGEGRGGTVAWRAYRFIWKELKVVVIKEGVIKEDFPEEVTPAKSLKE